MHIMRRLIADFVNLNAHKVQTMCRLGAGAHCSAQVTVLSSKDQSRSGLIKTGHCQFLSVVGATERTLSRLFAYPAV
jgi:hypothetical protein